MDLFKMKIGKLGMLVAVGAVLAFGATRAIADGVNGDEDDFTITASVQNAVSIAETTPMDFGTMVVVTDGMGGTLDVVMDNASAVTWPGVAAQAAPWDNVSDPRVFPTGVRTATAGTYTITGAAFDANMGIVYNGDLGGLVGAPGTATVLTCGACVGAPTFDVDSFTDNTTAGIIAADGTGTIVLNVGATLKADNTVDNRNLDGQGGVIAGVYGDGDYTGTVSIAAIY